MLAPLYSKPIYAPKKIHSSAVKSVVFKRRHCPLHPLPQVGHGLHSPRSRRLPECAPVHRSKSADGPPMSRPSQSDGTVYAPLANRVWCRSSAGLNRVFVWIEHQPWGSQLVELRLGRSLASQVDDSDSRVVLGQIRKLLWRKLRQDSRSRCRCDKIASLAE
jgi:hypothetical protein